MSYVDGFMIPVPADKREEYREIATRVGRIFKEYGALQVVECWGDDVPAGEVTSMPMAVQCQEGETVVFSWIRWPSREARDLGHKKCMEDPRMQDMGKMPFDGKRLIYGGFEMLFEF